MLNANLVRTHKTLETEKINKDKPRQAKMRNDTVNNVTFTSIAWQLVYQ